LYTTKQFINGVTTMKQIHTFTTMKEARIYLDSLHLATTKTISIDLTGIIIIRSGK